jgi:hypothetical protein
MAVYPRLVFFFPSLFLFVVLMTHHDIWFIFQRLDSFFDTVQQSLLVIIAQLEEELGLS